MPEREPILDEEDPIHQFFGDIKERLEATGHAIRKLKEVDSHVACDGKERGMRCEENAGWEIDHARYCFEHSIEAIHLLDEGERSARPEPRHSEEEGYREYQEKEPKKWN